MGCIFCAHVAWSRLLRRFDSEYSLLKFKYDRIKSFYKTYNRIILSYNVKKWLRKQQLANTIGFRQGKFSTVIAIRVDVIWFDIFCYMQD